MNVDFSQELKQLDGKPLQDKTASGKGGPGFENVTLATVSLNALMAAYEDERGLSGEEKVKRFDLATAIYAATAPIDLPSELIALIKKLVAKGYGPLIVGQAWKMLEGKI
ncbi:MAG: hypothetical protein ACYDHF_06155 [Candidatus Cryosericum sp.]